MPRKRLRLNKCYEYGTLRRIPNDEEDTWLLEAEYKSKELQNYDLTQALNFLSSEGWELVCNDQLGYILKTPILKRIPSSNE
jgi:hypothetical protein